MDNHRDAIDQTLHTNKNTQTHTKVHSRSSENKVYPIKKA